MNTLNLTGAATALHGSFKSVGIWPSGSFPALTR